MRTEAEIRERFKDIEAVMEIILKLDIYDATFFAFHTALEWVLQDSEVKPEQ